ncbi:MAG: crossover junction endodeoxyribonuclease RuvC [Clostridia bacterium]|nr:crossover junction endodeoxyribonuclease RuvC [Clostridia bacterium]
MVILGIDPGLERVGYGVIEVRRGSQFSLLDYGVIKTPAHHPVVERLTMIEQGITQLMEKYHPDEVAVEELFFTKNVTTGIVVAEARGVILVTAHRLCGQLFEYTPNQIKQAITGWGGADKQQIQQMVKIILKMSAVPKPDDAADALAVAITHGQTGALGKLFRMQ